MRNSNVAQFVEGEFDPPGVRTILILHPSTAAGLRQAPQPSHRSGLGETSATKSEQQSGPGVAPVARATEGASTSAESEARAFQRVFLIATAVLLALSFALFVHRHSQLRESTPVVAEPGQLSSNEQASSNALLPQSKTPVIVLTSPPGLEGQAGEEIRFPMSIDATEALPARSLVAIGGMPEGASFSEGRPYGINGWSLRPDEIGDLRLLLPKAKFGSYDLSIELLAADGGLLGNSETRLKLIYQAKTLVASANASVAAVPQSFALPLPTNDINSENPEPPKVTTVETLAINPGIPPRASKEVGLPSPERTAEWVLVISSVNVHPGPNRSSKTIKVAAKGAKLRVLARKRGWVKVGDPTGSVEGWIYRRFLKPSDPPA
jgi:hypothetical protein